MNKQVELYTSSQGGSLGQGDLISIRIGSEVASMIASEWSQLVARPKKIERAKWPQGIDDLVP